MAGRIKQRKIELGEWVLSPAPGSDMTLTVTLTIGAKGWKLKIKTVELYGRNRYAGVDYVTGKTELDLYEYFESSDILSLTREEFYNLLRDNAKADERISEAIRRWMNTRQNTLCGILWWPNPEINEVSAVDG